MKTCTLFVSVNYYAEPPEAKSTEAAGQLLAGHPLTVSNEARHGFVRCTTHVGTDVWIDEQYVSHAKKGGQ